MFALVLYIRMAVEVYETFQEKGIADQVYFDTFSDFRIWNEECKKKYGICGLTECEWLKPSAGINNLPAWQTSV